MDQALYAKACEVTWKHKDLYAEVLLRLGTFHTIFNLRAIIGKRFQDTGLRYICTESGIIAEDSCSLRRPQRRCTIMQIEFTSAYTRPYCKKVTGCYISMQFIIWSHGSLHTTSLIMQDIWCTTHKWRTFQWIILMYVHWNFMEGHFSVQLAGGSPFRRILVDQTMDVTFNKDTKTTGILTRFILKTGAVKRFYLMAEYRCAFLDQLRSLVQAKWPQFHQDEMQSPRMHKDEEQVLAVEALIESWHNPFVGNQDLNRIATAKDAPVDMPYDLLHACGAWEQKFLPFKEERLQSSPHKKRFYDPVKLKNWRCLHHSVRRKQSRLS